MNKSLVIIGAGGHGKVAADIALNMGFKKIFFLDDNTQTGDCSGLPIVGKTDLFEKYSKCDFFVAIGNPEIRQKISDNLKNRKCNIVTLMHPNAVISRRVKIGIGTVVMAGVIINSDTVIGEGCIINTSSSVDHDCIVEDYSHISVGAHLAGNVRIGQRTWVGAGATVSNNIQICSDCMVGAGAVVVNNINERGTYIGVPAKMKK